MTKKSNGNPQTGDGSPITSSASDVGPVSAMPTTENISAEEQQREKFRQMPDEAKWDTLIDWISNANAQFQQMNQLGSRLKAMIDAYEQRAKQLEGQTIQQPQPQMPQMQMGQAAPMPQMAGGGSVLDQIMVNVGTQMANQVMGGIMGGQAGLAQAGGVDLNSLMIESFREQLETTRMLNRAVKNKLMSSLAADITKGVPVIEVKPDGNSPTTETQATGSEHPE